MSDEFRTVEVTTVDKSQVFPLYNQKKLYPYSIYFLEDKEDGHIYKLQKCSAISSKEWAMMPITAINRFPRFLSEEDDENLLGTLLKDYKIYTVPPDLSGSDDFKSHSEHDRAVLEMTKTMLRRSLSIIVEGLPE